MLNNLTGWHFLIILVIVLLLFGAPKLPGLARSLGQSMKIFKSEIKSDEPEHQTPGSEAGTSAKDSSKTAGPADPNSKS